MKTWDNHVLKCGGTDKVDISVYCVGRDDGSTADARLPSVRE